MGEKMASTLRERLKSRIAACGFSMKQIDEALGLSAGFMFDFISGRKKTLSDEVIRGLADKLKTSEIWLLRGIGSEDVGSSGSVRDEHDSMLSPWGRIRAEGVERVMARERKTVAFTGMNFVTGSVSIQDGGSSSPAFRAIVVDPDIMAPGNAYAEAFSQRQPLRVIVKRVVMADGQETWVILDQA